MGWEYLRFSRVDGQWSWWPETGLDTAVSQLAARGTGNDVLAEVLNALGRQHWELITQATFVGPAGQPSFTLTFKRPLPPPA